ncbi:MAG: hypothetical protein OXU20_37675 [Myxococcales bacterium]|nr:hypothetical protein [Myxococcales bacterium]
MLRARRTQVTLAAVLLGASAFALASSRVRRRVAVEATTVAPTPVDAWRREPERRTGELATELAGEEAVSVILRRLERVERDLAQLSAAVQSPLAGSIQPAEEPSAPLGPSSDAPGSPEVLRDEELDRQERLDRVLMAETEDLAFRDGIVSGLHEVVESRALDVEVAAVECGSTFCKVEARAADGQALEQLSQAAFQLEGLAGASLSVARRPDGTLGGLIYLVHEAAPDHPALN